MLDVSKIERGMLTSSVMIGSSGFVYKSDNFEKIYPEEIVSSSIYIKG